MQKITPFLWFDNNLEEAIEFYSSIFDDAKVINITKSGKAGPGPEGTLFSATFQLAGQTFMAMNAGPMFKFNEAISFLVSCKDQQEIDYYWEKLTAEGGEESMCGWLKDRFGLSWQIVPSNLGELLWHSDPEVSAKVMQALYQMHKLDIAALKQAAGK